MNRGSREGWKGEKEGKWRGENLAPMVIYKS